MFGWREKMSTSNDLGWLAIEEQLIEVDKQSAAMRRDKVYVLNDVRKVWLQMTT